MLKEIAQIGAPLAKPDDPIWTTTIMTYELGNVIRALCKARNKSAFGDEKGERAYLAEARIELADLLTQAFLLAEQMGWKRMNLINDGYERFCQRMHEYEEAICQREFREEMVLAEGSGLTGAEVDAAQPGVLASDEESNPSLVAESLKTLTVGSELRQCRTL